MGQTSPVLRELPAGRGRQAATAQSSPDMGAGTREGVGEQESEQVEFEQQHHYRLGLPRGQEGSKWLLDEGRARAEAERLQDGGSEGSQRHTAGRPPGASPQSSTAKDTDLRHRPGAQSAGRAGAGPGPPAACCSSPSTAGSGQQGAPP